MAQIDVSNPPNNTLLFSNLRKLTATSPVDSTAVRADDFQEGPKGLAAADLDGDGRPDVVTANKDGTVAVLFGIGGGLLEPARHLPAGTSAGLRDVIAANVMGDGRPEIIAAHPFDGKVFIFAIEGTAGSRTFGAPAVLPTWVGARGLAAGDFNGDGMTDLVVGGAGEGLREYRGDGSGGFTPLTAIAGINVPAARTYSATPVFTMQAWRRTGELRDRVTVAHAESRSIWFLGNAQPQDPLALQATLPLVPGEYVYDLAMGFISSDSRSTGWPDLLTAAPWASEILVRPHIGGATFYPASPQQRITVPGAPRALSVADVNGDSLADLLVAARQGNSISTFLNQSGRLVLASEAPAGSSPRDVATADFDGNGFPDAAVINRHSEDVTMHRIDPVTGWFYQSPLITRVPGGADSVIVANLRGTAAPSVLYVTATTGQVTIRTLQGGAWSAVETYYMGGRPQSIDAVDTNGDGKLDLLCATLGEAGGLAGMTVRLQQADGTFGDLQHVEGTAGVPLLGSVDADFDNDGLRDRAVIAYDCTILLFQGTPNGLAFRRQEFFAYEARSVAAVDLDGDGDLDLLGAGAYGHVVLVENTKRWFTGGPYLRTQMEGPLLNGAFKVQTADKNGDGFLDLTVFSQTGVAVWHGAPGLVFTLFSTSALARTFDTSSADFDGDGVQDTFALCPSETTASFFRGTPGVPDFWLQPWLPFGVPSSRRLVTGDFDGDGRPDLAGVGEYLWIALSGTAAPPPVPAARVQPPPDLQKVVINEILASTKDYIPPGVNAGTDCVEIFNGSGLAVNLLGWKLRRVASVGETQSADFVFPAHVLPSRARLLVFCTGAPGPFSAPFKLPEAGASLVLLDSTGQPADAVNYPRQQPDVAYGRIYDGAAAFIYNPYPTIGGINYDNGDAPPVLDFNGIDLERLKSGQWRFRANAWAPAGMFTLVVEWREVTSNANVRSGTILLYDDGMHDDGAGLDGGFAGDWTNPLPTGTAFEFFLRGTNLRFRSRSDPGSGTFAQPNEPITNYTFALPSSAPGWEISEVVPRNLTYKDEAGKKPDWAELRFTGAAGGMVQDLFLSDSLFRPDTEKLYELARAGSTVAPGQSRLIFLSGTPFDAARPLHANFKVEGENGDSIFLLRRLPSGAYEYIDHAKVPPLEANVAYARLGPGGPFVAAVPSPNLPNAPKGGRVHLVPGSDGGQDCIFAFPGGGRVEASSDLVNWTTVLPWQAESAIERVIREPVQSSQRYFRVR